MNNAADQLLVNKVERESYTVKIAYRKPHRYQNLVHYIETLYLVNLS